MRRWLLAVGMVLALPALLVQAQPGQVGPAAAAGVQRPYDLATYDLETTVRTALTRNAALKAAAERRAEVEGGVEEVAADAWPQVDVVSSWSRSRNPAFLTSPDFDDIIELFPGFEPGEQELWALRLEVNQPLYTGGKVRAAIDLAELVVDITDSQIAVVQLDTAAAAAENYYRLLAAESAVATVEAQQRSRQEALTVVEARLELGEATRLELLRAEAALVAVVPQLASAQGAIVVEQSRLRGLLGLPVQAEVTLAPSPAPSPRMADPAVADPAAADPAAADQLDLSTLLQIAEQRRPALRDLQLRQEALQRQRIVTVADGRPRVDFRGAYGRQARLIEDLGDDLFADWSVALTMKWNVFDGGRRSGQVAQIDSQRQQTQWQLEQLRRDVALQVEQSLAAYHTANQRAAAAKVAVTASREAERVARESYQLGVALQADLLDAQDQVIRSELTVNEARYDRLIEAVRLRRAIGLLPTESWSSALTAQDSVGELEEMGQSVPDEFAASGVEGSR